MSAPLSQAVSDLVAEVFLSDRGGSVRSVHVASTGLSHLLNNGVSACGSIHLGRGEYAGRLEGDERQWCYSCIGAALRSHCGGWRVSESRSDTAWRGVRSRTWDLFGLEK